jgi:probable F420-dependent oxidoreductase
VKFLCGFVWIDPTQYLPLARAAEASGWDGVVLSDHLVHIEKIASPYPYHESGERPWQASDPYPDVWVSIGAMAAVTERLRFYQGVHIVPLRDPFSLARAIGTAAVLSGDRVSLGFGLGWMREEFELLGARFDDRARRAEEMLAVMRKLWSGEMVEHAGEFYRFPRVRMLPAPPSRIPIYVGGTSDAALRRAARHDGWEGAVYPWDEIEDYVKRARAARLEAAGTLDGFRLIVGCTEPTPERLAALREWGVTDYLKPPWTEGLHATKTPLAYKLDEMSRFAETYRVARA